METKEKLLQSPTIDGSTKATCNDAEIADAGETLLHAGNAKECRCPPSQTTSVSTKAERYIDLVESRSTKQPKRDLLEEPSTMTFFANTVLPEIDAHFQTGTENVPSKNPVPNQTRLKLLGFAFEYVHATTPTSIPGGLPDVGDFDTFMHFMHFSQKWRTRYDWQIAPGNRPVIAGGLHPAKIAEPRGCPTAAQMLEWMRTERSPGLASVKHVDVGYEAERLAVRQKEQHEDIDKLHVRTHATSSDDDEERAFMLGGEAVEERALEEKSSSETSRQLQNPDKEDQQPALPVELDVLVSKMVALASQGREKLEGYFSDLLEKATLVRQLFLYPNNLNFFWSGHSAIGFTIGERSWEGLTHSNTDAHLLAKDMFLTRPSPSLYRDRAQDISSSGAPLGASKNSSFQHQQHEPRSGYWQFQRDLVEHLTDAYLNLQHTPAYLFGSGALVRAWNICLHEPPDSRPLRLSDQVVIGRRWSDQLLPYVHDIERSMWSSPDSDAAT
ncbi:unnamed protein product [Amoebophrya sp. A25]|nr:unnamed protein product [Amoebophrya sp. A25]|eukprot:GSA25T00001845001.1